MNTIWRGFRIILTLSLYFLFAPFGYIAVLLWTIFPTRNPERRARFLQWMIRRGFLLMHDWTRALGIIDCNPREFKELTGTTPGIIVANHPTLTDVTSIFASVDSVVSIVKPSIYHNWWARPLLKGAGFFPGPQAGISSAFDTVETAIERLEQGYHVMFFPEGTRSPADGMHRFGRLPFLIACEADVPVYPVFVDCQPRWLSKDHPITDFTTETPSLRLKPMQPVYSSEVNGCSRKMRELMQSRFEKLLEQTNLYPTAHEEEFVHGGISRIPNQKSHRRIPDAGRH